MFTGDKIIKIKLQSKEISLESALMLAKRCKAKWFSYKISSLLYFQNPDSPLQKSYRNSMYCADSLLQQGEILVSHYCKNRWCLVCNRIRTAVLIQQYMPRLQECEGLWFVTLTRPNVSAEALKRELADMQKIIRHIQKSKKFQQYIEQGVIGIRKTEVTYNPVTDTYHPHYHLMVDSEDAARYLVSEWLRLSPAAEPLAQDIRRVRDLGEGCKELFKYFSKFLAKDKSGKRYFDAKHMSVIFEAMVGRRVFQRFGRKSAWRCEEIDEDAIEEEAVIEGVGKDGDVWKWLESEEYTGYYCAETGEPLVEIAVPEKLGEMFRGSVHVTDAVVDAWANKKDGENGAGEVVEESEKDREDIGKCDIAKSDDYREACDRRALAGLEDYGGQIAAFDAERGHIEWSPWRWRESAPPSPPPSPPNPVISLPDAVQLELDFG